MGQTYRAFTTDDGQVMGDDGRAVRVATRDRGPEQAPDLHFYESGRPDSNWRPSPWQSDLVDAQDLELKRATRVVAGQKTNQVARL